ncbi:MAG: signal peptidase I [Oscillospiraceae bacterium]|nr:signal peptidase I [Oscillospiraceae bacterium]
MEYTQLPGSEEVERELKREQYKRRYRTTMKSTVFALTTAAAAAVLVATLWLPVLQIFGSSMTPTLQEGQIVVSVKVDEMKAGDIVAFYYGNKVLIKRYIAGPGTWVDVQEDGTVLLNGTVLEEPYLTEKALGICDLEFPYQVPEGTYFLMGDQRETSVDSRHSSVGCIAADQIVGKIIYRVWPFEDFGMVH